jgi:ribosome-binding protein aMBF1 (putative translation factor)
MIKNYKQYRIAKAHIRRFEETLPALARQERPANVTPRLWQAQRAGVESQLDDLRRETAAYERLQKDTNKELLLEAVEDLPKALIRARIAAGMTQAGLARCLGIKPQQVQRYEATDYQSASFGRISKVVRALGLRMPKPARLVRGRP